VRRAVSLAVSHAVFWAVGRDLGGAVGWAVWRAVDRAVGWAVNEAVDRPHPHLKEFLRELQEGEER